MALCTLSVVDGCFVLLVTILVHGLLQTNTDSKSRTGQRLPRGVLGVSKTLCEEDHGDHNDVRVESSQLIICSCNNKLSACLLSLHYDYKGH